MAAAARHSTPLHMHCRVQHSRSQSVRPPPRVPLLLLLVALAAAAWLALRPQLTCGPGRRKANAPQGAPTAETQRLHQLQKRSACCAPTKGHCLCRLCFFFLLWCLLCFLLLRCFLPCDLSFSRLLRLQQAGQWRRRRARRVLKRQHGGCPAQYEVSEAQVLPYSQRTAAGAHAATYEEAQAGHSPEAARSQDA